MWCMGLKVNRNTKTGFSTGDICQARELNGGKGREKHRQRAAHRVDRRPLALDTSFVHVLFMHKGGTVDSYLVFSTG
jgi:hypothetical protein